MRAVMVGVLAQQPAKVECASLRSDVFWLAQQFGQESRTV
jgi:hypothetical protein